MTANLVDFPATVLERHGLIALHPDDVLIAQFDLDNISAIAALRDMRARSRTPRFDVEELAKAFERNGLVAMSARVREAAQLL